MDNEINTKYSKSNVRLYSLLSYIGILWIVGALVKEKDDELVKFHVGQGMILFIFNIAINIISNIVEGIFDISFKIVGNNVTFGLAGVIALVITIILALIQLTYMIIGIINACNFKKEKLPIIGSLAFYK